MKSFLLAPYSKQKPHQWLLVLFLGITLFFTSPTANQISAQSADDSGITLTASVGLDGYCKAERWMPVRVKLENTGADYEGKIDVIVLDGFTSSWHFSQAISLAAVSRKEVTIFTFIPSSASSVTVAFVDAKGSIVKQIAQNLSCIPANSSLVGVWAATPSVYNIFTTLTLFNNRASVAQLEMADLPTHAEGFAMLDMLVISDVDTGILSEAQRQALEVWVENGGRLVVAGGPGWQKTSAGLTHLLPIQPSNAITFPDLNGLQWFSPDSEALQGEAVVTTGTVKASALVLANQGETPLILRRKAGFGDVYFLAADPALAPLRNWSGMEQMYQYIFATPLSTPSWARGFTSWYEASSAISNIPGLGLPSIFLICGFLGMYIVALGPLNYLILRQLKRRELAWISIPVLVILFSMAAFLVGLTARGTRPVINELAIVQVWPDEAQAKVHGLVGTFSPNRSQYNIEIGSNFLAHPLLFSPLGNSANWHFAQTEAGVTAENVRIDVGGIEALVVSGSVPAPDFASDLSLTIQGSNLIVRGEVVNQSELTLQDAILVGPGQVQKLGNFGPGMRETVNLIFQANGNATPNTSSSVLPSSSYDTTLQDFFGISYLSNYEDKDLARRFNLLQASLGYGGGRGGGIYLLGWSNSSPLQVGLDGKGFRDEQTSIYIIALTPEVKTSSNPSITIPPALFTWTPLSTSSGYQEAYPYGTYLYANSVSFRFQLSQPILYRNVTQLTLHLTNYGSTGPHGLIISLWDFTANAWVIVPADTWGDHDIPEPERYVGFGGEVRIQIENPSQTSQNIERSDFTLVVEQ